MSSFNLTGEKAITSSNPSTPGVLHGAVQLTLQSLPDQANHGRLLLYGSGRRALDSSDQAPCSASIELLAGTTPLSQRASSSVRGGGEASARAVAVRPGCAELVTAALPGTKARHF